MHTTNPQVTKHKNCLTKESSFVILRLAFGNKLILQIFSNVWIPWFKNKFVPHTYVVIVLTWIATHYVECIPVIVFVSKPHIFTIWSLWTDFLLIFTNRSHNHWYRQCPTNLEEGFYHENLSTVPTNTLLRFEAKKSFKIHHPGLERWLRW